MRQKERNKVNTCACVLKNSVECNKTRETETERERGSHTQVCTGVYLYIYIQILHNYIATGECANTACAPFLFPFAAPGTLFYGLRVVRFRTHVRNYIYICIYTFFERLRCDYSDMIMNRENKEINNVRLLLKILKYLMDFYAVLQLRIKKVRRRVESEFICKLTQEKKSRVQILSLIDLQKFKHK